MQMGGGCDRVVSPHEGVESKEGVKTGLLIGSPLFGAQRLPAVEKTRHLFKQSRGPLEICLGLWRFVQMGDRPPRCLCDLGPGLVHIDRIVRQCLGSVFGVV